MEFELWYLVVVPVLFMAGWWFRGFDSKQRASDAKNLPQSYSRGVSLLLNDQPDKAIDAFIEVVKIDPELIELHHVLGNLFCRRGEFERAIRLHNHLVNRADLPQSERTKALSELGEDYLCAGFFDRAEETFKKLLDEPSEHLNALRALLKIYCTEHEWPSAIDTARALERQAGEEHSVEIAHFYCELAEQALKINNPVLAQEYVDQALTEKKRSPRANILAGNLALARADQESALFYWHRVIDDNPLYMPLVVGRIADLMAQAGDREGALMLLKRACADAASIDVMNEVLSRVVTLEGLSAAQQIASHMLQDHPSLSAFSSMIDLRLQENPDDEQMKLLATLLKRHSKRLARYQCSKCGFLASSFTWHCLGCGAWDSYPPRRIEDTKAEK